MYGGIGVGDPLQLLRDILEFCTDRFLSSSVNVDVEQMQIAAEYMVNNGL